jgi:hypothetical protein
MTAKKAKGRLAELLRSVAAFIGFGIVGLAGLEIYVDRWAWPISDEWYRLEISEGTVTFGCQRFRPVRFSEVPPPGVTRILLLGGSATFGYPTHSSGTQPLPKPVHGFAGVMQSTLDSAWPGSFELVNLGVNGGGSEDSLRLLRRARDWGAQGLVIYDGNNEYMGLPDGFSPALWKFALYRRLSVFLPRIHTAPGWVGAPAHGGPVQDRAVLSAFRSNLEKMVELASDWGLPTVIATQPSNLAGLDPNWSTSGAAEILETLHRLGDAEVEDLWAASPASADLAWEAGLRRLAAGGSALEPLRAAVDHDGLRFRATTSINGVIREVAQTHSISLVDADALLVKEAVPGLVQFYDWGHPRQPTAETIAMALLAGMEEAGMLPGRAPSLRRPMVPKEDFVDAELRSARSWLQWACVRAHAPGYRLQNARSYASSVLVSWPGHSEAQAILAIADVMEGGAERMFSPSDPQVRKRLSSLHPLIEEILLSTAVD